MRHLDLDAGEVEQLLELNERIQIKGFIFNYYHSLHQGTAHDAALTVRLE